MKKRSFTLIEVLIVLAVFGIIFALTFEILSQGGSARDLGSAQQDAQEQANQGLESMVTELYQTKAEKILDPTARPFSNSATLTFQIPSGYDDANGMIIWGAGKSLAGGTLLAGYKIKYSVNNSNHQLIREVLDTSTPGGVVPEETKVLANFIESLSFSLDKYELLTVTLKAQKAISGIEPSDRLAEQEFSAKVSFRN